MSRIGRLPITVPAGVTVTVDSNNLVTVKGPKGTLSQKVNKDIKVSQENGEILDKKPVSMAIDEVYSGKLTLEKTDD